MRTHFDGTDMFTGPAAKCSAAQVQPSWRTLFISDVHLGTSGCQAEALLAFLKAHPCQHLHLVGDMVDGWQLKRRWFWPEAHNRVIQKLLRMARKGCRITFVPGNHDEFARAFDGHHFGGIEVANGSVYTTANGLRLWVIHGDQFDGVIGAASWLAHLGDVLYGFTLWLNRPLNRWRYRMGQPYWSLSVYLKFKVKQAVMYVGDYEQAVARETRRRGFDGVVCGHIHHPEIRNVHGILYCNDGDWVESNSALAEGHGGRLTLLRWKNNSHASGSSSSDAANASEAGVSDQLQVAL